MRIISLFLISCLLIPLLPSVGVAADLDGLGLTLPNITNIRAIEQKERAAKSNAILESPIDEKSYRIGPGDILAVHIIVGNAELSINRNLSVWADGKVFFPNIGEIYLSGLSLAEAKNKIDQSIRKFYKHNYKLSVMLKQPKRVKIYLTGMVKNPGPLTVYDNSRVSEVVSSAGGNASGASTRYFYIHRKDENGENQLLMADIFEAYRNRDTSKDIRIQVGDIIEVPDANNELLSQLPSNGANDQLLFEGKETFVN